MAFTIDIQDRATPAVAGALSELQLAGVKPAIGRAVARLVQQHFLRLNRSRANPLGGTRTNFYAQAARHTRFQVTSGGVRLTVDQVGIRQRLQGGQILPRHAAYLTLPVIAQAYGRRAGDFSQLELLWRRIGGQTRAVALVEAAAKSPRARGLATASAGGKVFFWLVQSVTQKPDPSVLPTDQEMKDAASAGANEYFRALLQRIAQGGKEAK